MTVCFNLENGQFSFIYKISSFGAFANSEVLSHFWKRRFCLDIKIGGFILFPTVVPAWWRYIIPRNTNLHLAFVVWYEALRYLLYTKTSNLCSFIFVNIEENHEVTLLPPSCYERERFLIKRNLCYYNVCEVVTVNTVKFFNISKYRPRQVKHVSTANE